MQKLPRLNETSQPRKPKAWYRRLSRTGRLILLDEHTFEEQWSLSVSVLHIIFLVLGISAIVAAMVILAFIYTPLKNVIPGYVDEKWRKDATYSRTQVDSLLLVSAGQERYIQDLNTVLSGGLVRDTAVKVILSPEEQEDQIRYVLSPQDSALRARIAEEDRYTLSLGSAPPPGSSGIYLYTPLVGSVSAEYDAKIGHYGIDIVAPMNSIIKSVFEGTVILASWTSDGGYVIQIQHPNNLISVYKHNSVLLKKTGDKVEAGDAIAIIGDSGEETDGPHLHFEIWKNGAPVNPREFFSFGS